MAYLSETDAAGNLLRPLLRSRWLGRAVNHFVSAQSRQEQCKPNKKRQLSRQSTAGSRHVYPFEITVNQFEWLMPAEETSNYETIPIDVRAGPVDNTSPNELAGSIQLPSAVSFQPQAEYDQPLEARRVTTSRKRQRAGDAGRQQQEADGEERHINEDRQQQETECQRRRRNEDRQQIDILARQHNSCTIPLGFVERLCHPKISSIVIFLQELLVNWHQWSNLARERGTLSLLNYYDTSMVPETDTYQLVNNILGANPNANTLRRPFWHLVKDLMFCGADAAAADLQFPGCISFFDKAATAKQLAGALKSMTIKNYPRVLRLHVIAALSDGEIDEGVVSSFATVVSTWILGRKGSLTDLVDEFGENEEDLSDSGEGELPEEDPSNAINFFREHLLRVRQRLQRERGRDLKDKECDFFRKLFQYESIHSLRQAFLPKYLHSVVDGYRTKLHKDTCLLGAVWRLFAAYNRRKFVQLLFPQPNTKACHIQLNSTRLALLVTMWFKRLRQQQPDSAYQIEQISANLLHASGIQVAQFPDVNFWKSHPNLLWRFCFPGVYDRMRKKSLVFANYASTDGFAFHGRFFKLRTHTAKNSPPSYQRRNSAHWRSQFHEGERGKLARLVGGRDPLTRGLCSLLYGFRGIINLDEAIKKGLLDTGPRALSELLHNRVLIGADPGVINSVSLVAVLGDFDEDTGIIRGGFVKTMLKNAENQLRSGLDRRTTYRQRQMQQFDVGIQQLAKNHPRTMDPTEYESFLKSFNEQGSAILESNSSRRELMLKELARRKRQSQYMDFLHSILALCDGLDGALDKAPVLILGSATFGAVRGRMSPFPGPGWLRRFLSRYFLVVLVNEHNTSQKCPKCFEKMQRVNMNDVRHFCCSKCRPDPRIDFRDTTEVIAEKQRLSRNRGRFLVNKDISAAMNMVSLALAMLLTGQRPLQFCSDRMANEWKAAIEQRKKEAEMAAAAYQAQLSLIPVPEDEDVNVTMYNNSNHYPASVLLPRGEYAHNHVGDEYDNSHLAPIVDRLAPNTGSPDADPAMESAIHIRSA